MSNAYMSEEETNAIFIANPKRTLFHACDLAEDLWTEAYDQFEVTLSEEQLEELLSEYFFDYLSEAKIFAITKFLEKYPQIEEAK